MNMNGMLGRLLLACLLSASVFALDPSRDLTQYAHTGWRVRDGYFSAPPQAIAQTKDGQLWLGGEGGLLRFDGVRFSPWTPPQGQTLPDARIFGLLGASDGSLWIGTGSGLARWKNDQLVVYAKAGRFSSLLEDHHGTIWAGHTRAQGVVPPLCEFAGNEFKCFAFSDRPGMSWVGALKEDRNGDLWIGTAGAVCRRRRMGQTKCYVIPTSNPFQTDLGIQCIAIGSDDVIWLDGGATGIWFLQSGQWKHYREFPQLKLELGASLVDREGELWFGDVNHGLIRHVKGRVERFDQTDGLSGETVTAMLEDREGSVWVATSAGLDRFREVKVATITRREGLPLSGAESVVASRDGGLWIAGTSELIHTKIDRPGSYKLVRGRPENGNFDAIFEDSHGRLWLGVGRALAWRENGQFHKVPSLKLHQVGERVRAFSEDIQGDIWAATTDPELPLVRIRDGRVLEHFTLQQLGDQICAMAADPKGGMWLSRTIAPGLILVRDGTFEMRAETFPGSAGNMFFDSHGLWASTRKGVVSYENGILNMLTVRNGLPCDDLDAAIKDDSGALWLKGTCGLIRIPASELELWLKDPGRHVQIRYLDAFDGAQAGAPSFVRATKTSDGRIWFALERIGVQVVDPKRLQDNPTPPPVAVTKLVADHRPYDLNSELRLPALTRDFEIDYTAYSLMIPEKVQFRYRLEGVDKGWQDVGSRRQAYFTNLKPGRYRFDLLASNNDGVWNEVGASLDFSVAPAYYQTWWFRSLCMTGFLTLLWALYRWRILQLRNQEKRLRDVVDTIPAMAFVSQPDGYRTFVNKGWVEYTGMTVEQSLGSGWHAAIHPEDLRRVLGKWEVALASGKSVYYEARYRRAEDGQYRWFIVRVVPQRDKHGKILKWYGTASDMDDRKRAEELQSQLAHINRVSMMGELSASLSHELKQPIAAAVLSANSALEWLNRDEPNVERARETTARIVKYGTRAADIIDRLRSLYKKTPLQHELVDVNEVVGEMAGLLRDEANHYGVSTRTDLPTDLPKVTADRVQIQQVLMNLMLNGIEAMKETGGVLTVKSQLSEGGRVMISVSDTGVGLPADKVDDIFNAYVTTKPQGSGMGLAISRSIVESYCGRLWASANDGRGATFHFTLSTPAPVHEQGT